MESRSCGRRDADTLGTRPTADIWTVVWVRSYISKLSRRFILTSGRIVLNNNTCLIFICMIYLFSKTVYNMFQKLRKRINTYIFIYFYYIKTIWGEGVVVFFFFWLLFYWVFAMMFLLGCFLVFFVVFFCCSGLFLFGFFWVFWGVGIFFFVIFSFCCFWGFFLVFFFPSFFFFFWGGGGQSCCFWLLISQTRKYI